MSKRDEIARLGREEHDFREERRKAKRDARRGKKKQRNQPKSPREFRVAHLRGPELDAAARAALTSSRETTDG